MTSTYAILATVELLHEYYADGRCPDFSVTPDAATAARLRGAAILSKTLGNALVLLVKVDEDGVAERKLSPNAVLRFHLNLERPQMLNYTNLELPEDSCLYFSNRSGAVHGTELHLNKNVPAYSATGTYRVASLAVLGGTVYEAIRPVTQNDNAPGDAAYWSPRDGNQYIHTGDLVRRSDGRIRLSVSPARVFSIDTFAFNPETGVADIPVGGTERQEFEAPVSVIALDRQSLSPGIYRIRVNAAVFDLLIDREGTQARSLGMIELSNLPDPLNAFALFDADGRPRGQRFLLRFANRLAIWKYRLATNTATGISIPGQSGVFVPGATAQEYISVRPLPLRQQPIRNIQLLRGTDVLASRLANPPPERISRHTDAGVSWYCAEMRLNY